MKYQPKRCITMSQGFGGNASKWPTFASSLMHQKTGPLPKIPAAIAVGFYTNKVNWCSDEPCNRTQPYPRPLHGRKGHFSQDPCVVYLLKFASFRMANIPASCILWVFFYWTGNCHWDHSPKTLDSLDVFFSRFGVQCSFSSCNCNISSISDHHRAYLPQVYKLEPL